MPDDVKSEISSVDEETHYTSSVASIVTSHSQKPQLKQTGQAQQDPQERDEDSPLQRSSVVRNTSSLMPTVVNKERLELSAEQRIKLETQRREKVDEWVETLKEPLEGELEALEKEADLAEDSFGSLDIPLTTSLHSPTKPTKTRGQLSTYVYAVRIQSCVRRHLACKLASKVRNVREMLRDDLKNSGVMGSSLSNAYEKLFSKQEELMEDSFGSDYSAPVDNSIERDVAQLELAVSNYEGALVDHETASKKLDREVERQAQMEQKRIEEEKQWLQQAQELREKEKQEKQQDEHEQKLRKEEEEKRRLQQEQELTNEGEIDKEVEVLGSQGQGGKEINLGSDVEIDESIEGV